MEHGAVARRIHIGDPDTDIGNKGAYTADQCSMNDPLRGNMVFQVPESE